MHMVKTQDEDHGDFSTVDGALEHLSAEGLIGVGSSGEGVVVDTSDDDEEDMPTEPPKPEPTATDGGNPLVGSEPPKPSDSSSTSNCCSDPSLSEFDQGEGFRAENGAVLQPDQGDKYCENCGAFVEPDGRVIR